MKNLTPQRSHISKTVPPLTAWKRKAGIWHVSITDRINTDVLKPNFTYIETWQFSKILDILPLLLRNLLRDVVCSPPFKLLCNSSDCYKVLRSGQWQQNKRRYMFIVILFLCPVINKFPVLPLTSILIIRLTY